MTNSSKNIGRRSLIVALIGVLTLAFGVVAPTPNATAAFGKPTSVNAKAISGSNGITVTWKAPSGKPAAYRVYYGTSSSRSKASSKYVAGTSVTISSLTTSTNYYVWVQPWSAASSTGKSTGAVSSSDKVKTSKYAYKAPIEIHAVNATKTSMEVTWRTVTGSPGYVLRAQAKGQKTKYQYGFDGSAVFTGLKSGVSYKFTVANRMPIANNTSLPGVRLSGYSSASSTKATNKTTVKLPDGTTTPMANQPTNFTVNESDHDSIKLSWTAPAGYNAAKHVFRVYWAEDQEMTDHDDSTTLKGTSGEIKGLDSNTNYYVRIRMLQNVKDAAGKVSSVGVSDRTEAVMAKTRSPKGYISGTVTGVSGSVLADYVAVAYSKSSGDVNAQVPVSSAGKYRLEVRPGDYYVQIAYVGSGNYVTEWVDSGGTAYTRGEGTTVKAKLGNTPVTASTVSVGEGAILTGKATNAAGKGLRDVFVSARTGWTSAREVVSQDATDSSGNFTLRGLPPGKGFYVRANGSLIGYGAKSSGRETAPSAGKSRSIGTLKLPN